MARQGSGALEVDEQDRGLAAAGLLESSHALEHLNLAANQKHGQRRRKVRPVYLSSAFR